MKIVGWIIALVAGIVLISFAVNNFHTARLDLWPAPFEMDAPVFAIVFVAILIGFFAGAMVAWLAAGGSRRESRRRARQVRRLSRELRDSKGERSTALAAPPRS